MFRNQNIAMLIAGAVITVAIAITFAVYNASPARAECIPVAAYDETVIDTPTATIHHDAVDETFTTIHHDATHQRYSLVGGPVDEAPVPIPPSDEWQANTTNYEGAGHGTDPIGVAFQMDNPGRGNADWFFWTSVAAYDEQVGNGDGVEAWDEQIPAVTHVVHHDAVTCIPDEPPLREYEENWRTDTCEAYTVHTEIGFYGHIFDPIGNVWVEDAEPTVTSAGDSVITKNGECETIPDLPETLAYTGFGDFAWLIIDGILLLTVGLAFFVTGRAYAKNHAGRK